MLMKLQRFVLRHPRLWISQANVLRGLHDADIVEVEGPAFAESITEGDIRWVKAVGDFVAQDEIVAEIETDKTTVDVPAQFAGVITELLAGDGDKVLAKQKLYKIDRSASESSVSSPAPADSAKPESVPSPPAPPPKVEEAPPKTASTTPLDGPIPTSMPPIPPLPTKPMYEAPVSTPVSPRVTQPPIAARAPSTTPPPAATTTTTSTSGDLAITGARAETRIKMNRMRKRIAERLKDAQNTYAMLTTFNEIDMSRITELRNVHKDSFLRKHGVKLGFMSAFIRASAYALRDQPVVNAVIEDEEIVYRHYSDISVAVATPKGLVVPVLRGVEHMSYADIEKGLFALGEKAKENKLAVEDMDGGTFTISNGGVFGSMMGTPIINPPQSSILGMHAIIHRPVAVAGKVEIRPMMYVALTYDHRLVDGREAVTFLKKIKSSVEDPASMFLDL